MKEKIDSQSPDGEISVGVIGTDDAGDSERRRIPSSRISSKLADNKLLLENVFEDLERFDFPSTVFFSSTDRSRFGAAQTLTGMTRRPSTEKSLKNVQVLQMDKQSLLVGRWGGPVVSMLAISSNNWSWNFTIFL